MNLLLLTISWCSTGTDRRIWRFLKQRSANIRSGSSVAALKSNTRSPSCWSFTHGSITLALTSTGFHADESGHEWSSCNSKIVISHQSAIHWMCETIRSSSFLSLVARAWPGSAHSPSRVNYLRSFPLFDKYSTTAQVDALIIDSLSVCLRLFTRCLHDDAKHLDREGSTSVIPTKRWVCFRGNNQGEGLVSHASLSLALIFRLLVKAL